jgi:hypothetical protein
MILRDGTATATSRAMIGFLGGTTQQFTNGSPNSYMGIRLENTSATNAGLQLQHRTNGSGALVNDPLTVTTTAALVSGNWYRLSALFTKTSVANQFSVSATLEDFGTSGTSLVSTVLTQNWTFVHTEMAADTSVFAGFRTSSTSTGVNAFDNFNVAIPEPGTYAAILGAGALVGLVALRRRRA